MSLHSAGPHVLTGVLASTLIGVLVGCIAPSYEIEYRALQTRGKASDFQAYLQRHPDSPYTDQARARLAQLQEEETTRERLVREEQAAREKAERNSLERRTAALAQARRSGDILTLLKNGEEVHQIGVIFSKIGQPLPGDKASHLTQTMLPFMEGIKSLEDGQSIFSSGSINNLDNPETVINRQHVYFYKDHEFLYFETDEFNNRRFQRIGYYKGAFYSLPAPIAP